MLHLASLFKFGTLLVVEQFLPRVFLPPEKYVHALVETWGKFPAFDGD